MRPQQMTTLQCDDGLTASLKTSSVLLRQHCVRPRISPVSVPAATATPVAIPVTRPPPTASMATTPPQRPTPGRLILPWRRSTVGEPRFTPKTTPATTVQLLATRRSGPRRCVGPRHTAAHALADAAARSASAVCVRRGVQATAEAAPDRRRRQARARGRATQR